MIKQHVQYSGFFVQEEDKIYIIYYMQYQILVSNIGNAQHNYSSWSGRQGPILVY